MFSGNNYGELMFVENKRLNELQMEYGTRFIDGVIGMSDGWNPVAGIWIAEEKFKKALQNPEETTASAHPQWTHERRKDRPIPTNIRQGPVRKPIPHAPLKAGCAKCSRASRAAGKK
jgi:hypothetical protein